MSLIAPIVFGVIIGNIVAIVAYFNGDSLGNSQHDRDNNYAIIVWSFVIGSIIITFIVNLIISINKRHDDRKLAESQKKATVLADVQRHREQQQQFAKEIDSLIEESVTIFESLPILLSLAEEKLDQATVDFHDRAFIPFWESIGSTVNALGRFDEGVNQIQNKSSRYNDLISQYENTVPEFPLEAKSVRRLDISTAVVKRMHDIVRKAQCDIDFTSTFLQFKTNQILIAGFNNLGQALEDLSYKISTSIDDLSNTIYTMNTMLHESMSATQSQMGGILEINNQHLKVTQNTASQLAGRTKRALAMLDNIQRDRKPIL